MQWGFHVGRDLAHAAARAKATNVKKNAIAATSAILQSRTVTIECPLLFDGSSDFYPEFGIVALGG